MVLVYVCVCKQQRLTCVYVCAGVCRAMVMCMFMRVDMCVMYVSFCVQYKVYAHIMGKLPESIH